MSDEHDNPTKLRWWFWLVLLLPAIVSPLIPWLVSLCSPLERGRAHAWVLVTSHCVLLPMDAICSIAASMIFAALKGTTSHVPRWCCIRSCFLCLTSS
jgi:hypothetical protein